MARAFAGRSRPEFSTRRTTAAGIPNFLEASILLTAAWNPASSAFLAGDYDDAAQGKEPIKPRFAANLTMTCHEQALPRALRRGRFRQIKRVADTASAFRAPPTCPCAGNIRSRSGRRSRANRPVRSGRSNLASDVRLVPFGHARDLDPSNAVYVTLQLHREIACDDLAVVA